MVLDLQILWFCLVSWHNVPWLDQSDLLSDSGSGKAVMVSAVCRLRELSVLVQNIYWTDFSPTLGVVYCYGLVGYATV